MHDTTEEYLETILELEEEGIVPIRARLVERLGLRPPAVSETGRPPRRRRLRRARSTTAASASPRRAAALATTIVRRHRLAERLLVDVIGLEWEKVHREADRWEHAISADVEEKLVELLGDPATCPHGNPIPGSRDRYDTKPHVALADAAPGAGRVVRISEKLELDDDALALLASSDLIPGQRAEVTARGTDGVTVTTATRRAHGAGRASPASCG